MITPASADLPYEDAYFLTIDNKRLNGWFVPNDKAKFTALFCHGNAGNISHRIDKILILRKLGLNIFVFDYRGYGNSKGTPSEPGLYRDGEAAYEYLVSKKKISKSNIVLYGESIGAAVVIDLASKREIKAIITEEAFTSVKDMAGMVYPFLPYFVFASRFDSASKIRHVSCPKLIIHSVNDEIVPFSLGQRLFDEASPPKRLVKLRGGHNTAFLDSAKEYEDGISSFLGTL